MKTPCIEHSQGGLKQVYGIKKINGISYGMHRLAYCSHTGSSLEDLKGLVVRHKCDNRRCINPEHLEVGTQKDNCADRSSRGRSNTPTGDRCTWAKVSAELRTAIKNRVESGEKPSDIARNLGISRSTVSYHIHGRKR